MSKAYNISGNLHKAIERAIYIAEDLQTEKLNTAEVVLSVLLNQSTTLQQQHIEEGIIIDAKGMLYSLTSDIELYEEALRKKYPMEDKSDAEKENAEEEAETEENEENEVEVNNKEIAINIQLGSFEDFIEYPNIEYTENLEAAFEDASNRCNVSENGIIDEDNLLYSILNIEDCSAARLLTHFGFEIEELINMLEFNANIYQAGDSDRIKLPAAIETCCEVLNSKYEKGQRCDILGRDKEIFKAWNIFSKKTKRNAILVGPAGVGKTAIVEAMTMQIVNGKCPKEFKKYNIISLDLNSMVAGTKYRGEFEKKVQTFINFIKSHNNLIVFVDEIHQILGAGGSEGSGPDLSGSLKPILSRDDVVFIGSTTDAEYERYFKRDPAFDRRFEKIEVKEPSLKNTKKMVKLRVDNLSAYHGVEISEDILDYIIITAKAMNYEGNNPDVTLDLVDRAMAISKIRKSKKLERKDVDKVYAHNYETFRKISKKDKRSTAYHEAGHALVRMLSKYDRRKDVKIISIVPADDYLGVTISEENDSFKPVTRNAVLESASMSLAGRVAQEFVDKNWDFGASNDLVQATDIIRRMIVEMGMDSNIYTNISLYSYQDGSHVMSPQAVDMVNDRIKEIMKEVYESTKQLLEKHKEKLDIMAGLLMERGIISINEVYEAFKEAGIKMPK